jgi:uncharacterized protein YjbI with pentapeptide repeats
MSSELVQLIRKGRAAAFYDELLQLQEDEQEPTIEGETFKELNLQGFRFVGVDMTNVELDTCTLTEVTFEDCILEGMLVSGSTLFDCVFIGCTGEGFAFDTCTLGRTKLQDLDLEAAEWSDTQFHDCVFDRVKLREPVLERLTIKGGAFKTLQIEGGELSHVTLRETQGNKTLLIKDSEANHCYVAHDDEAVVLPEGFSRKTGRRRTL